MKPEGHPIGSQCVITRVHPNQKVVVLGQLVTITSEPIQVGDPAYVWGALALRAWTGRWIQAVELDISKANAAPTHPIAWMRPIDKDITADDGDVVRQMTHRPETPWLPYFEGKHTLTWDPNTRTVSFPNPGPDWRPNHA